MKIIFLDIDGVLNFKGCMPLFKRLYFVDDSKLQFLKEIVDQTGARIVLSSTWKIGWEHKDNGMDTPQAEMFIALEEKLKEFGLSLFSKTPSVDTQYRGNEIKLWLEQWSGEPITSFVIIDDGDDMKPFIDRLIRTSFLSGGLQAEHFERAIKMLNED